MTSYQDAVISFNYSVPLTLIITLRINASVSIYLKPIQTWGEVAQREIEQFFSGKWTMMNL